MKTLMRGIGGIVVIAILVGIILLFIGWSKVPDIIAGHLSKTLKVAVEIGDISASPKAIQIEKFEIGNPPGYRLSRALGVDTISIEAPISRYFHDHIEIDEIDVNNVYLGLEFDSPKGTSGNWTTIMANAQRSQEEGAKKGGKTVLIRRLILNNIRTDLLYRSEGGKIKHLPLIKRIELKNISSTGGNISDQLMNSALGEMIKEVFIEQNLKDMLQQILSPGGNPLDNAIQQFKGFFHTVPKKDQPSETLAKLHLGPDSCFSCQN